MAQHDYNLANQSGADFRADLNNALSAIVTVNSGASAPSTTFAHQLWVDTSSNVLKIRNAANDAWVTTGVSITADNTFTGNITGNAATATALATARTINGASFDGTANISFGTDSVSEGSSNLYFTNARVESYLDAGTSTPTFASAVINTSITGSAILDDDTFGTASAITVATSESIKAYVDSQVGSVDTLSEILANGNTTGGTDIAFGDNDKAVFGTGSDLEIYHDGSNSIIKDAGAGNLELHATNLIFKNSAGDSQYASFFNGGAVTLRYAGAPKVSTTSTGIDVTGTVKASTSLMVGSTDAPARDFEIKTTNPHIRLTDTDASGGYTEIFGGSGITTINADKGQAVVNSALKLSVDATDGLTIDSNHNVDIPNGNLDVTGTVTSDGLTVEGDATIKGGSDVSNTGATLQLESTETQAVGSGASISFKGDDGSGTQRVFGVIKGSKTSATSGEFNGGLDFFTRVTAEGNARKRLAIASNGDISFYEDTGTTQALFWDASAESLCLGNTSAGAKLDIRQDSGFAIRCENGSGHYFRVAAGGATEIGGNVDVTGTVTSDGLTVDGVGSLDNNGLNLELSSSNTGIIYDAQNGYHTFKRNGTNALQINGGTGDVYFYDDTGSTQGLFWDASAERLGLGTTSPSKRVHIKNSINDDNNILLVEGSGTTTYGIYLKSSYAGQMGRVGALSQSDGGLDGASVAFEDFGRAIAFRTNEGSNNAERARFISGGAFLIGKTGLGVNTQGLQFNGGLLAVTKEFGEPLILNRKTTDGVVADFRKDNISVGSTRSFSGDLIIQTGITGLRFNDANDAIHPVIVNGSVSDGATDLGLTNARFKDLYLSGTANVGSVTSSGNIFMSANGSILRNSGGALQLQSDASVVILRSNNTTALTLDTSQNAIFAGKIGIGTTAPSSTLHLRDTTAQIKINSDNGQSAYLTFGDANDTTRGGLEYTSTDDLKFQTNNMVDQMVIRYTGNVGIGTASPSDKLTVNGTINHTNSSDVYKIFSTGSGLIYAGSTSSSSVAFITGGGERARLDTSGNLLVGTTSSTLSSSNSATGINLRPNSASAIARSGGTTLYLNRLSSDGEILALRKDGSTVGSIASKDGDITIGTGDTGLRFNDTYDAIYGANSTTQAGRDASIDLGMSTQRFKDIYATNGTIQTSDINEKQDIEELSEAETRVAVAAKGLLKKYRWKSAVADKGDDARIHFGIMAQDLQQAFSAEGLDAGDYGMFISSTWTDETTGEEKTRLGVRYNELLAFIIAAI